MKRDYFEYNLYTHCVIAVLRNEKMRSSATDVVVVVVVAATARKDEKDGRNKTHFADYENTYYCAKISSLTNNVIQDANSVVGGGINTMNKNLRNESERDQASEQDTHK